LKPAALLSAGAFVEYKALYKMFSGIFFSLGEVTARQ